VADVEPIPFPEERSRLSGIRDQETGIRDQKNHRRQSRRLFNLKIIYPASRRHREVAGVK
jgi:hypothetical protein